MSFFKDVYDRRFNTTTAGSITAEFINSVSTPELTNSLITHLPDHLNFDKSRPQSYYSARLISDTFKEPYVESHLSSVSTFIPKAEPYDCAPPDHFYRNPYLKETFVV